MKKIKSLFVMSGIAAAAVLAFSAPAQAGYDDGDDIRHNNNGNNATSTYNDCGNVSSHSLIGLSLLNNLLGEDDSDSRVTVICDGGDIDD